MTNHRPKKRTGLSILAAAGLLLGSVVSSFAAPVNIEIQNGGYNGNLNDGTNQAVTYTYSLIHDASQAIGTFPGGTYYDGGVDLFTTVTGNLTGDLSSSAGTLTLSGIGGSLTTTMTSGAVAKYGVGSVGATETFTITGGTLSSTSGGPASGSLAYTLSGPVSSSGTFYFNPIKYLTQSNSPNRLTNNWLYLWGDNWMINGDNRPTDGSALGLDLTGTITPVPLPAAAWLFGSGLLALAGRTLKRHA